MREEATPCASSAACAAAAGTSAAAAPRTLQGRTLWWGEGWISLSQSGSHGRDAWVQTNSPTTHLLRELRRSTSGVRSCADETAGQRGVWM